MAGLPTWTVYMQNELLASSESRPKVLERTSGSRFEIRSAQFSVKYDYLNRSYRHRALQAAILQFSLQILMRYQWRGKIPYVCIYDSVVLTSRAVHLLFMNTVQAYPVI